MSVKIFDILNRLNLPPHKYIEKRIERISFYLLGRPYMENPLSEKGEGEKLITSLDGFDCVTYVETVLALALAQTEQEYPEYLRLIRYKNGNIDFLSRHHYMSQWIAANKALGIIRYPEDMVPPEKVEKVLSILYFIPVRRVTISYWPISMFNELLNLIKKSALVFFVSKRKDLDVFHMGYLILDNKKRVLLRHASRSVGKVVEEDFYSFVKKNNCNSILVYTLTYRSLEDIHTILPVRQKVTERYC